MPPLTDPDAIRALLETDRPWSVYALGDLDPARLRHSAFFHAPGHVPALALLYRAFSTPVLFTLGPPDALRPLLDEIAQEPALSLHVPPDLLPRLETRFEVRDVRFMWRMLLDPARFRPPPAEGMARLGPADLEALRALYADGAATGESPEFFFPGMLDEGVYVGAWEDGALAAAAGT